MIEFKSWPKTTRLFSPVVITEKLDGSNCAIVIQRRDDHKYAKHAPCVEVYFQDEYWYVAAQSRNRLLTLGSDHQYFCKWVYDNAFTLVKLLGEGHHFGEWMSGNFYLFNVKRWANIAEDASKLGLDTLHHVPVLYEGTYYDGVAEDACVELRANGSRVDSRPAEGVVIYWPHDNTMKKYFARKKN